MNMKFRYIYMAVFLLVFSVLQTTTLHAQTLSKVVYSQGSNIFIMNGDGTNRQQLTTGENSYQAQLSPNAIQIVFVSDRDGNDEIYTMSNTGTNVTRLTNNTIHDANPYWSSDGMKIV